VGEVAGKYAADFEQSGMLYLLVGDLLGVYMKHNPFVNINTSTMFVLINRFTALNEAR